ncbi:MAG: glycosyltransferase [Gemmataceae bacterium]
MKVSVVICTWNRADLLDSTLSSMNNLEVQRDLQWELIVVNNNSTDHTDEVIRKHESTLPIRGLFESRPGKSHALNLAGEHAQGELIAWTDDDVLVEPNWLSAYFIAAEQHPEATFFGGPVEPWFEQEPPQWFRRNKRMLSGIFAGRPVQPNEYTTITQGGTFPVGANMVARRDRISGYTYDTRIGPRKNSETRGEDFAFVQDLLDNGHSGIWVNSAKVRHFTPTKRITTQYVWDWYVGHGRTLARQNKEPSTKLFGVPRWALTKYLRHRLLSSVFSPLQNSAWLKQYTQAATCYGFCLESREVVEAAEVGATEGASPSSKA